MNYLALTKRVIIGMVGAGVFIGVESLEFETINLYLDFLSYSVLTLVLVDRIKGE